MPRTALAPILGIAGVVLFLALSWTAAFNATPGGPRDGFSHLTETAYVQVETVYGVQEGDIVTVTMWPNQEFFLFAQGDLRLLIVEGGEGDAYAEGGTAQHVLHDAPWDSVELQFERPAIYDGKPHEAGGNGDLHDAIDLVFLYEKPPGMSAEAFAYRALAVEQMVEDHEVLVADATWLRTLPVWYTGMVISGSWALFSGYRWVRSRPEKSPPPDAGPLDVLVSIQARAWSYLRTLRDTMRAAGALLVVGGLGSLFGLNGSLNYVQHNPSENWTVLMMMVGWAVFFAAVAIWAVHYHRIAREVRRWAQTPSPLDA